MDRRRYLALAGTLAVAGCLGDGGDANGNPEPTPTYTQTDAPIPILGSPQCTL